MGRTVISPKTPVSPLRHSPPPRVPTGHRIPAQSNALGPPPPHPRVLKERPIPARSTAPGCLPNEKRSASIPGPQSDTGILPVTSPTKAKWHMHLACDPSTQSPYPPLPTRPPPNKQPKALDCCQNYSSPCAQSAPASPLTPLTSPRPRRPRIHHPAQIPLDRLRRLRQPPVIHGLRPILFPGSQLPPARNPHRSKPRSRKRLPV